jgi:hypothetical protein
VTKLRQSARGQPCHLRLPGVCCHDSETVVLAHLRRGGLGGVGMKVADVCAVYACRTCHDAIDGRSPIDSGLKPALDRYILEGHLRTLDYMWSRGLIKA